VASLDELAHFAHRLADLAAVVQRRYFRQPVAVDTKADQSPVTIADREAEARMRDLIRSVYPAHGILGEEHGADALDAELVWVLDPIDGTKSFIAGRPLFGTLVGLLEAGRPVLGIIDQSILHERWVGVSGRQTTLNGAAVGARPCAGLADAVLMTTSPLQFHGDDRRAFDRLTDAVRQASFGGDCYAYALVATGFVDLVVEAGLKPYDFAAIIPVIEGAGGQLTDWEGGALGLGSDGRVIASGDARTHEAARRLLAGAA
jgi:inositol-phosphate phosphatase/L-galactose 1-phosphate phosphatase/histidinol-phosphatase